MRIKLRSLALLSLLAAAAAGCSDVTTSESDDTIMDVLASSTAHGTLRQALIQTNLDDTLGGSERYTIFAPTDAAFDALAPATRQAILGDPQKLAAVLRYHIVSGRETANDLTDGRTLTTLQGQQVTITRTGQQIRVNNATLTLDNVPANNGVVHVINAVLVPQGVL